MDFLLIVYFWANSVIFLHHSLILWDLTHPATDVSWRKIICKAWNTNKYNFFLFLSTPFVEKMACRPHALSFKIFLFWSGMIKSEKWYLALLFKLFYYKIQLCNAIEGMVVMAYTTMLPCPFPNYYNWPDTFVSMLMYLCLYFYFITTGTLNRIPF